MINDHAGDAGGAENEVDVEDVSWEEGYDQYKVYCHSVELLTFHL